MRRRRPAEPAQEPQEQREPVIRDQGTYRVAVSHTQDGHPESRPAHWGPAYNESFREVLAHATDVQPHEVDLLAEARKGADRAQAEHGDDYAVWVERLVDRDGHGEWERV